MSESLSRDPVRLWRAWLTCPPFAMGRSDRGDGPGRPTPAAGVRDNGTGEREPPSPAWPLRHGGWRAPESPLQTDPAPRARPRRRRRGGAARPEAAEPTRRRRLLKPQRTASLGRGQQGPRPLRIRSASRVGSPLSGRIPVQGGNRALGRRRGASNALHRARARHGRRRCRMAGSVRSGSGRGRPPRWAASPRRWSRLASGGACGVASAPWRPASGPLCFPGR